MPLVCSNFTTSKSLPSLSILLPCLFGYDATKVEEEKEGKIDNQTIVLSLARSTAPTPSQFACSVCSVPYLMSTQSVFGRRSWAPRPTPGARKSSSPARRGARKREEHARASAPMDKTDDRAGLARPTHDRAAEVAIAIARPLEQSTIKSESEAEMQDSLWYRA